MARYINAVNAAEIISDKLGIALSELVDVMATVPTADVQEVKHGYWKSQKQSGFYRLADYECSICGYDNDETPDYCAFCGARMDGDSNDG